MSYNLKIKKYKDDYRKTKLKKISIACASIGLSAALISSGIFCYVKKNEDNSYVPYYDNTVIEDSVTNNSLPNYIDDSILFEIKQGVDPAINKNYKTLTANLSDSEYNKFVKYISNLDSKYKYEKYYGLDEAIERYKPNNNVKHSNDITNGTGILTETILYNSVINNNDKYLKDTSNLENNFYEKASKDVIQKACHYIVECLNKEFEINPDIDQEEIFCFLSDLVIAKHKLDRGNAFVNENNVLSVNEDRIKNYGDRYNMDFESSFRQVLYHETMHMIQSACKDNEDQLENYGEVEMGICHKYEDLDINPFFWNWFLEASAEKEMAKVLNEDTHTYSAPIGYYDSLILCSLLNKDVSTNDTENLNFDKNGDELFRIFNTSSKKEKLEIVKMMYTIEVLQNKPSDFCKKYKEDTGIDIEYAGDIDVNLNNLRLDLRIDILKTFTKEFYKSLANQVKNGNITLDTVYYLINIYESDVYIHLFFNEADRIKSGVEFFDFYTEIQNQFFNSLANSININYNDIINQFENYSMNVNVDGKTIQNYDLSSLGEEDSKFLKKKEIQNYQTGIPNIRSMPKYCIDNGYKK